MVYVLLSIFWSFMFWQLTRIEKQYDSDFNLKMISLDLYSVINIEKGFNGLPYKYNIPS
jgi:hypothetical protein